MSKLKLKIRKGDTVKVLSGKDKGKTGKVLRVLPAMGKVVVENVNVHTKFERSKRPGQPGQRISAASPLPVSKVMLMDSGSGKATRIGYQFLENGVKQRIARVSGKAA
jgi:large subunit ribosomal protein L24